MKLILSIVIILFFRTNIICQDLKIEIEVNNIEGECKIIPINKNGIFILYKSNENNELGETKWVFSKYDTAFYQNWNLEIGFSENEKYIDNVIDKNYLYLLFTCNTFFKVIKVNISNSELLSYNIKTKFIDLEIEDFSIINDEVFIGGSIPPNDGKLFMRSASGYVFFPLLFIPGYIPQRMAAMVYASLNENKTKDIDFGFNGYSSVSQIYADSLKEKVFVIINNNLGSESRVHIQEYNLGGSRGKSTEIKPLTRKYNISDARIKVINVNKKIVIGTYRSKNKNGSQGIYLSGITKEEQKFISYTSFTQFNNFFNLLDSVKKAKILTKINRKRAKGKDYKLETYVLLHDIIIDSNQYIIVGEIYEPQYHTEYRVTWYYGRPVEQPYIVFDGWNFTHAITAGLDENGRLKWDNIFDIQDILSNNLSEKVKFLKKDQNYVLSNLENGTINYQIISKSDLNHFAKKNTLNQNNINNSNKYYKVDFEYFYEGYFLVYGIKVTNFENSNSSILFLDKIKIKN
ncbi:MAG: hypothetical protein SFY32_02265 [Bacteroidota bacterium]|nr:hypothetical protein [Bacteroidota bacterium]